MRKGISILFALIILLSGARVTIATHFCGGTIAATKISLSGKLASCGMEGTEVSCPHSGNQLGTHCCDDLATTIGIIDNFTAPVVQPEEVAQNIQNVLYAPDNQSFHSITAGITVYTSFNPPGRFLTNVVNLEDICVFRI